MKTSVHVRSSPWPARLDLAQSLTGLFLALFMWLHMFFVSSILIGKDAFWIIIKTFDGYFFFGKSIPALVSFAVAGVFAIIVIHSSLALRKFPASWQQYHAFWQHMRAMQHEDTTLWLTQVATGFAMFFLASVHLYVIMSHPDLINPYGAADRMWTNKMWPLYLLLLFAVEIHGVAGLYRLALKWGWFTDGDPGEARERLWQLQSAAAAIFLIIGLATLADYIWIGIDHAPKAGKLYTPTWVKQP